MPLEDIKTFFKFVIVKVIILSEEVMHVEQIRVCHVLTSFAVMPSGGFLTYFSLSSSTNFGFIVRLLPFAVFSMKQTGDEIKHICHWSGNDILPLPFHRVFEEKQACVCGRVPMPCIEPIITGHLEMPFRDMLDKEGNKVHDRESFFHMGIILVFIVVESHVTAIVRINTGGGNNRPAKVTADVFYDSVRIAEIWFGIDIEPIFPFFVNGGFGLAEGMEDADETGHKVPAFVLEMSE